MYIYFHLLMGSGHSYFEVQTVRQTDSETDKQTDRQTDGYRQTVRETDSQTDKAAADLV